MRALLSRSVVITVIILVIILSALTFVVVGVNNKQNNQPIETPKEEWPKREIIGISVEGREIHSYTYGSGETRIVFVGGIHGGYEWNSSLLSYQLTEYLDSHKNEIPTNLSIIVIPSANPDGLFKIIGKEGPFTLADIPTTLTKSVSESARFNSRNVDLNRNFDCNWQATSTWKSKAVSAGSAPFSEPEAATIRDFAERTNPSAFIFWHSQANAVYASECNNGILPKTLELMKTYSRASGYPAVESFDSYKVTGDAEGWLASIGIPAITVELKTHEDTEWEKNLLGIKAILGYFGQKK